MDGRCKLQLKNCLSTKQSPMEMTETLGEGTKGYRVKQCRSGHSCQGGVLAPRTGLYVWVQLEEAHQHFIVVVAWTSGHY